MQPKLSSKETSPCQNPWTEYETEVGAGAPEPTKCRARQLTGSSALTFCLVQPVPDCPFLLHFGMGGFCEHPEKHRIIARTLAAEANAAAPSAAKIIPLRPAQESAPFAKAPSARKK